MASTTVPFKTPLGHDELRSRTLRLGQRHRTVLFLIDGRRPLSEVLSLAQQAGAATSHFEDLVKLGLVELPHEPLADPVDTVSGSLDMPKLTSLEVDVPATLAEAPAAETMPEEDPSLSTSPPDAVAATGAVDEADSEADDEIDTVSPEMEDTAFEAPSANASPNELRLIAVPRATTPLHAPSREEDAGGALDSAPPPLAQTGEGQTLQQVRELLTDTLRLDAPFFSARTFMRVRLARSAAELIELVWEIENHLKRSRHTRRELQSLQSARELLGLGNTLVREEDTRPSSFDE
jgi:hypothetical protein